MLKMNIDLQEGRTEIAAKGLTPQVFAELVIGMREIYGSLDGFNKDYFKEALKESVDIVTTEDDDELRKIMEEKINALKHKQD